MKYAVTFRLYKLLLLFSSEFPWRVITIIKNALRNHKHSPSLCYNMCLYTIVSIATMNVRKILVYWIIKVFIFMNMIWDFQWTGYSWKCLNIKGNRVFIYEDDKNQIIVKSALTSKIILLFGSLVIFCWDFIILCLKPPLLI